MTFLGAGLGLRREHWEQAAGASDVDLLEIIPDHFFSRPETLATFAGKPLVFHDVGLSLGSAGSLDAVAEWRLKKIGELIRIQKPLVFSEHLSATRTSTGVDLGHLCPIQYTKSALDAFCQKVGRIQDALGVPVALENIAESFVVPGSEMNEAEFLTEFCEKTGAGVLLDLTNLLYNGRNHGFDPSLRLREFPLKHVAQVHLAGGVQNGGHWVDSHSQPVGRGTWQLLAELGALHREGSLPSLVGLIVERDHHLPSWAELVDEADRARAVFSGGAIPQLEAAS